MQYQDFDYVEQLRVIRPADVEAENSSSDHPDKLIHIITNN